MASEDLRSTTPAERRQSVEDKFVEAVTKAQKLQMIRKHMGANWYNNWLRVGDVPNPEDMPDEMVNRYYQQIRNRPEGQ